MFSYFHYLLSPNVRVLGERRTKSRSKGDKGLKYRERGGGGRGGEGEGEEEGKKRKGEGKGKGEGIDVPE